VDLTHILGYVASDPETGSAASEESDTAVRALVSLSCGYLVSAPNACLDRIFPDLSPKAPEHGGMLIICEHDPSFHLSSMPS
jgi:hypothetical protein